MQGYKLPSDRLARLFKQSREQWKARAAEKQKKLRKLEIKVRDLSRSRDYWKKEAQAAKRQLRELEASQSSGPQKGGIIRQNQVVSS